MRAHALLHGRLSRRQFLYGAGAAAVLAGIGVGVSTVVSPATPSPSPDVDHFVTAPGLEPFEVTVDVPAFGVAPGYVFITSGAGPGQRGPMIVDNAGELVWFRQVPSADTSCTNLKVQQYRGKPVLTWWQGQVVLPQGYGLGEYIIADTSYREITRVQAVGGLQGDLHEFVLTDSGTALFTVYQPVPYDLSAIGGPRHGTLLDSMVQEVDVATGKLLFEWKAIDHIGLTETYLGPGTIATDDGEFDFAHLNSIDVFPTGDLLISARHTWTVYKVNRSTGAIAWRLNGKESNFDVPADARFQFQHDATLAPGGGITVFDDGDAGPPDVADRSRGLALGYDETTWTVTLEEEYLPDPKLVTANQGSVQTLPNGNRFVGWGSAPYAAEYTHDGNLLFELGYPTGALSYRAFRFEWTGTPTTRPAVVARSVDPGKVAVVVSWNGATEVLHWRILAGRTAHSLEAVATVRRTGFQTAVTVATAQPFVAVEALDGSGKVVGTSETVAP